GIVHTLTLFCLAAQLAVVLPDNVRADELGNPDDLKESSNLQDLIEYAMANNPGLQASESRWKSSKEAISAARALPDPRMTYGHYLEPVETRVGPQERNFGLSLTIPWFQKLMIRGEVAGLTAHVEEKKYDMDCQKLIYSVTEAYYELHYLDESIAITEENLNWIRQFESIARTRYATGQESQVSTLAIQLELEKLKDRVVSLKDDRRYAASHLNTLLGRPVDAELPGYETPSSTILQMSIDQLLARIQKENPSLQALQLKAQREEASSRLLGKSHYPDVTIGINVIMTEDALDRSLTDSGKDPVILTVSLNLPIWFGQYNSAKESAKLRRQEALYEFADLENRLSAELEEALGDVKDAERRIDLYQYRLIPMAKQSQDVTLNAFSAGEAAFLEVIEAQRTILDMNLALERAQTDKGLSLARVEWLMGNERRS
ncbi:MAG: TolC family protein, partial [Candidatus Eisenbacteria bacterium]|nr:TolC family protein [Candidatus Eisenbacteria bacterium]